jgi:hypothetical protein
MELAEMESIRDGLIVAYKSSVMGKSQMFTEDGVTRSNTRHDPDKLLIQIQWWDKEIERKRSGRRGIDTRFITPVM